MSLTKRNPSSEVLALVHRIANDMDDPHDLIDLAILLTVLSYSVMVELENVKSSDEFIAMWMQTIKMNIDRLEGGQNELL